MRQLSKDFPEGLAYSIVYDTTPYIRQSVKEVFHTLRDAIILVAVVVLLFLQDWRVMILPMIDVPVSLVGSFAVMGVMGYSLNNLTLFAMVLAIGIVVDDAIVVLENVERQMSRGLKAKEATLRAMEEITGPIIAITLVLSAVFLPSVFVPGVTGQFFRQFALVISSSMIISAINAMTLTPSRAAAIFQKQQLDAHGHPRHEALPWWFFALLGAPASVRLVKHYFAAGLGVSSLDGDEDSTIAWTTYLTLMTPGLILGGFFGWIIIKPVNKLLAAFFGAFNRLFDMVAKMYGLMVARLLRVGVFVLMLYGGLLSLTGWTLSAVPKSFILEQDQGYLVVNVQLPEGASVQRTERVMERITRIALGDPEHPESYPPIPGVAHTLSVAGQSFLFNANGSNLGSCFVVLEPFHQRRDPEKYDAVVADKLRRRFAEIEEAEIQVFPAPPIQGLGNGGGFKFQVEQRGFVDYASLRQITDKLIEDVKQQPQMVGVFTLFRTDSPQIHLDIDRVKCRSLGVPVEEVFNTLQVFMGGYFVNLFNRFGRTWQVNLMADEQYRTDPSKLALLQTRNRFGRMVPLATLFEKKRISAPTMVMRYNMYNSAPVVGNPARGTSSGQILKLVEDMAARNGTVYEWTEIMYLQILAGQSGIYIFFIGSALIYLILAAKYESWKLPLSVILVVPMCLLCACGGMFIASYPIDIFVQIGFLVLVALAAKNAILMVEFAAQLHKEGKPLAEAAVEAAQLRLRPIVMTSFAFILGVVPLLFGEGAGAEMHRSLGVAVFSGMIGVTFFGLLLTPVFFQAVMHLRRRSSNAQE